MADTVLEVLLTPVEYEQPRDWSRSVCVVFDILRATTSMVTALSNGAKAIVPVATIEEAVALKRANPHVLLAGEREGVRITAELADGIDFDFGNSPREFTSDRVKDRHLVITTTNGTRALRACVSAREVLIGAFLNMRALSEWILKRRPRHLVILCSGTHDESALEDTLAAGALVERVWSDYRTGKVTDTVEMVRRLYPFLRSDMAGLMPFSQNGRRLLAKPELRADVAACFRRETAPVVGAMNEQGVIVKIAG